MLGRMFLHALAAAAVIGSAAAVYAASDGPAPATPAPATATRDPGNGYLKPDAMPPQREGGREVRAEEGEHHRGHHTRSHDDDDD